MLGQLLSIAQNTFTESIRQPIFVVLLLTVSGMLALAPTFTTYTLDDDNKLLTDLGLSTLFLGGLFLAAFTSAGVLDQEIRRRTVLTVLSKPVRRPLFIIGKYLGVTAANATAFLIWSLVFLFSVRHGVLMRASDVVHQPVLLFGLGGFGIGVGVALALNYFRGRVFGSTLTFSLLPLLFVCYWVSLFFGRSWQWQSPMTDLDGQLLAALFMVRQGLVVICAVAVAASTRLGQVLTLITCVLVLLVGLTSDSLLGGFQEGSGWLRVAYVICPNIQFYWLADALSQEHPVSLEFVLLVSGYTLCYVVVGLALAISLFQTRDVG